MHLLCRLGWHAWSNWTRSQETRIKTIPEMIQLQGFWIRGRSVTAEVQVDTQWRRCTRCGRAQVVEL